MIEFKNVSFSYDATPEIKSLKDFSLAVRNGECVLITGASGCGKSTLLRLLNGLIPEFYSGKTEGSIYIDGEDIQKDRIEDKAGIIGTVFQNPRSQFFNVDTTSELAFGLENLAFPEQEILNRINRTVRNFHIKPLMDRSIFELSGGSWRASTWRRCAISVWERSPEGRFSASCSPRPSSMSPRCCSSTSPRSGST